MAAAEALDPGDGAARVTDTFVPGPDTAREFRTALGCFSTGVTVITCSTPDGPLGFTANSFASVSLDPALVLWSVAKSSSRYQPFAEADNYCIHVMGADQAKLARDFAVIGNAFDGRDWHINDEGAPALNGCLARFECAVEARHDGGDHTIIIGRVLRAQARTGTPLLFVQGQYGRFSGV